MVTMKCPSCSNSDAYEGLMSIDCPNPNCRHFSGNKSIATATAPVPITTQPAPIPGIGNPGIPGSPGLTPGIAVQPALSVTILTKTLKANSIHISFKADGDPGFANKTVEFYFTTPHNSIPQVCTLSNVSQYYVQGVNADGMTTYTTHWLCTNDGVHPNDPHTLTAQIY